MRDVFFKEGTISEELKQKIFDSVEAGFPLMLERLKEIIAVKSVGPKDNAFERLCAQGNESRASEVAAKYMKEAGMEVDMFAAVADRYNAVGTIGVEGEGRSLLFNGHVDVANEGVESDWTHSPWEAVIEDGRMYGRGTTDMKGGLMCTIAAVKALTDIGLKPKGKVLVQAVCGEEFGEVEAGTGACVKRGHIADAGICVEASAPPEPLALIPASTGLYAFEIWVKGKSAHTSMRCEICRAGGEGDACAVSALDKIIYIYQGMLRLEEQWGFTKKHPAFKKPGHFTINPCGIYSGPTTYAINSEARLTYTAWFAPQDDPDSVKQEIKDFITKWCATDPWLVENPPEFVWFGEGWPSFDVPMDHPLCDVLKDSFAETMGRPAPISGFSAVCDASYLNEAGIPTVVMGPGTIACAHGADEYVDLQELKDAIKIYALAIAKWSGLCEYNN